MKPLRAFLFSCGPSGEWSSSAFRELEPLIEDTKAALVTESASAAIHVGFWRPETTKIAKLAQNWVGRLLLSESAIGSLPPPLCASQSSVGEIEGLFFRLALDGFGYKIDDPTAEMSKAPLSPPEAINSGGSYTAQGWVKKLINNKPEMAALLSNARIWDDATFEENVSSLEEKERVTLALDRFRLVTGDNVSQFNILDNLYACPGWLLEDELKWLELTVRTRNVCSAHHLSTVGDLAKKGSAGLLKLANMGQGSVFRLSTTLWKAFINGEALVRSKWQTTSLISNEQAYVGITDEVAHKHIEVEPEPPPDPTFTAVPKDIVLNP
jgi:hypothetical protein